MLLLSECGRITNFVRYIQGGRMEVHDGLLSTILAVYFHNFHTDAPETLETLRGRT